MRPSLEDRIEEAMAVLPMPSTLWVALSGGRDSTCLLLLAARVAQRCPGITLRAVHIHHGLQPAADDFVSTARRACEQLNVPLHVERVTFESRDGLEASARRARYGVFEALLAPGDTLWMAHHQQDQAETLLYRLMRGSGVRGLAGMPVRRALGAGWLERPLLQSSREDIETVLAAEAIPWCDDPTNDEAIQDRNYLRHQVMTPLTTRWPAASAQMARSAAWLREADELLQELAQSDLAALGGAPHCLPRVALCRLSRPRQRLVIHAALVHLNLALPPRGRLETLLDQLAHAGTDGQVQVVWPGVQARLWRETLFLLAESEVNLPAGTWSLEWDGSVPVETPLGVISNRLLPLAGSEVRLTLAPRVGGEKLRFNGQHRPLRKLLQEHAIPPWQRDRIVVAWHGHTLAGVLGPLQLAGDGWIVEAADDDVEASGRVER